jgi:alpha,alpha-trehalose-phosphate synthase [UDP-forming]
MARTVLYRIKELKTGVCLEGTMQLSYRLMLCLLLCVAVVSGAFAVYQSEEDMHAMKAAIERQARLLAESHQETAEQALKSGSPAASQAFIDHFPTQDHLAGVAVYNAAGESIALTPALVPLLDQTPRAVVSSLVGAREVGQFVRLKDQSLHILALPIRTGGQTLGALVIFQDSSFLRAPVWRHALTSVAQALLIVGITLIIVRWSLGKPLRHMAQWLRDLRTGAPTDGKLPREGIFGPLSKEVTWLASSLNVARAAAKEEARLRKASLSVWTAESLRISVQAKLNGSRLFAVSNREPYEHVQRGSSVDWHVPPSGLVTALEPVLQACDGTWIAQATGDADRSTADSHGRLRVPPDHPQYTLRRVWLDKEEEDGFYLGFSNEGLWPLCHIAHTRPIFRTDDWEHYRAVNQKFAETLLDEMEGQDEPFVLVQDYHFALLPRMVKERRPDARIALFWHIPWPNPEAFGICPWQRELLDGMLGADLVGFHIQAHCNNFLETVDRALESRIDWEHFAVNRNEHLTHVKPFPISVAFNKENNAPRLVADSNSRAALLRQIGVEATILGLGVDRVDYTKGIPERFRGIERLLEQRPSYREKLTFIQIGAPSRTRIKRYHDLMDEVDEEAERINRRFKTSSWRPIVFLKKNHSHEEIQPFYREADFCLVTSLHDGMNLVAKEYIAARNDEEGVLILSRFTGASHELVDALVVNPYDTDELAQAIDSAICMPSDERMLRMQRMRAVVKEHNVYRWAGNLIDELARVRLGTPASAEPARAIRTVA